MAGGTFSKLSGKVRPGTYINFVSQRHDTVGISERGTVIIPLVNHTWGPSGQFITLTTASPDGQQDLLGYSIYDSDPNRQMLLIREAFKKASKVLVYRLNSGTKASATYNGIRAEANYGGALGNTLTYTIEANPVAGYDLQIHLGGIRIGLLEGITTVAEMNDNNYITFTKAAPAATGNDEETPSETTSELSETAGVNLSGGTDVAATNRDITAFLDKLESVKFNTLAFPITDPDLQAAAKTKIKYIRESVGKGVQVVMPKTSSGDYEGVINVTNSVMVNDVVLTVAEACAWVAAATAGASNTKSNTYEEYEGASEVVEPKSHEEAVTGINRGELFFSLSEAGAVVVEYDINSLTSFKDGKDKTYRKNRVIRVFDTFAESIQLNFPPNKYDNSELGWGIMEGIGRSILKQFYDAGAITNVDYDNDFLVDRSLSQGDETFFDVGLQAVDSAEKLYFTISTR